MVEVEGGGGGVKSDFKDGSQQKNNILKKWLTSFFNLGDVSKLSEIFRFTKVIYYPKSVDRDSK
jgi:hypothetical protein